MKTLFTLFITLFLCSSVFAQSSKYYEEGYVVTSEGDTINGKIKYRSGEEIKDRIYVRISEEEKKSFKASKVKYFLAGDQSFISQKMDGEHVFLREWTIGFLELYEEQVPYSQGGRDMFQYQPYIRKAGEKELTRVKLGGGWKKQIIGFISDYQELADDVKQNKFKLDELGNVILRYNLWKEGDE